MAGSDPLVSVIIPAYGVSRWIASALDSVLCQSMEDLEVILINDGSPDSAELEAAILPFRSRIRYLSQPNAGAAAARNAGLQAARGTWVAFLDGDDLWESHFLENQLEFIKREGVDLAWADGWFIGEGPLVGKQISSVRPSKGPVTVQSLIAGRVFIGTSATVARRKILMDAGGFDESLRRAQDFELWVRLLRDGARAGYNAQPLIRYRVRTGSLSGGELSQLDRAVQVLSHIRETLGLSPADVHALDQRLLDILAQRSVEIGKQHLACREYGPARQLFQSAEKRLRSSKLRGVVLAVQIFPALTRWLYLRLSNERPT